LSRARRVGAFARALSGLRLPHRRDLPLEDVQRVLFVRVKVPELDVLENDFQRIADAAKLSPIASDLVENLSLQVGFRCVAKNRY
jgi:hypothetical protein